MRRIEPLYLPLVHTQSSFICFQVCQAAVGLMGDLCRALGVKVLPYCDETMMILLENLGVCFQDPDFLEIDEISFDICMVLHWNVNAAYLLMVNIKYI